MTSARQPLPAQYAPVQPAQVLLDGRVTSEVRAAISAGDPVMLVGRASASSGGRALDLAVRNLLGAAKELRQREGVLVEHLLPSREQLMAHHHTTFQLERHEALDGSPFEHRYSSWGGRSAGVVLLITTGTGVKVTTNFDQPALLRVARFVFDWAPAVLYARELARMGRGNLGPVVDALEYYTDRREHGPFIGDRKLRLARLSPAVEAELDYQGRRAKDEGRDTAARNRAGARARHGAAHPGRAHTWDWATHVTPPPGLITFRMRGTDLALPRVAMTIDTPRCWPCGDELASHWQSPRTADGGKADHVEMIRWLGSHLGTDGHGPREVASMLAQRGWSPPSLRRRHHGAPVTFSLQLDRAGRNNGTRALRSFLNNLDFYRTGTFTARMGDREEPIAMHDVLPPDGRPWITEPQYVRLREWLDDRPRGPERKHLFAGNPVIVNGTAAVLSARHRGEDVVYYFKHPGPSRQLLQLPRARPLPPLPHHVVAGWYAGALEECALPWAMQLASARDDADDPLRRERTETASEIAELTRQQALRQRELDPGTRRGQSAAEDYVKDAYDAAAAKLLTLGRRMQDLDQQIALSAAAAPQEGLLLTELVGFADALTRPYDAGHRLALRSATASLELSYSGRRGTGKLPGHDVTANLTLRLRDDLDTWLKPYQGTWTGGAIRRAPGRLDEAFNGLYDGRCLRETLGAEWKKWLPAVRATLGCAGPFYLSTVHDPRLLRLAMAVVHPRRLVAAVPSEPDDVTRRADPAVEPVALAQLARRLHEPVALLRAIHQAYVISPPAKPRWLYPSSPVVAALYTCAAAGAGTVVRADLPASLRPRAADTLRVHRLGPEWRSGGEGVLRLQPCRQCRGTRRAVPLLREAAGSLCLDCRTDRAAVRWDERYDSYLDPVHGRA